MAGPRAETDYHGPQHANDAVLDMAMFVGAAECELAPLLASPSSGELRGEDIAPEETSRSTAALMPSQGAAREPLEVRIAKEILDVHRSSETVPTIRRVHPSIRKHEPEAYEPKLISIGPLHRHNECLWPMEEIKLRYVKDLLWRSPENILSNYVSEMRARELQARSQYAEEVSMDSDDFVRMLVVDGCFIIEYFLKRVFKQRHDVSGVRWGLAHLRRDLMLLENQLPFFVLKALFEKTTVPFVGTREEPLTLMEIALAFLKINRLPMTDLPNAFQVHHLLHLHHICLDPSRVKEEPRGRSFGQVVVLYPFTNVGSLISLVFIGLLYLLLWPRLCFPTKKSLPRIIPCATELDEAGVKFEKKKAVRKDVLYSISDVSFEGGTLKIPSLLVDETTSSHLRNFIALEQYCPVDGGYFTRYAMFMDNIISTESDVAILRKSGIIESMLDSDEVAKMFNALRKDTPRGDACLSKDDSLSKNVRKYSELPHYRWRAILVRTYFSNPWTTISLLAAIVLLGLTVTQTYFTIHPSN